MESKGAWQHGDKLRDKIKSKKIDLDKKKLAAMETNLVMSQKQQFEHLMLIKSPPKTGCIIISSSSSFLKLI